MPAGPMFEITSKYGPKDSWAQMYEQGITPWNLNEASFGIQKLLAEKRIPESGSFLIPGCGEGYDCFALVNGKREVYGVDLVQSVVDRNLKVLLHSDRRNRKSRYLKSS
jgi:hypothetical protein